MRELGFQFSVKQNTLGNTVVWKIFVRIYFVVKYFRVNKFRGLSIPTKIF